MFTKTESTKKQSESTTPVDSQAAMDGALAAIGMEFDPLNFHRVVDGEAKPEGSVSACPYARFFSKFFGSDKG